MRLHIVNPNTTVSMTDKIARAARAVASPDVEVVATQPDSGPASIEGYYDEAFAVPGVLHRIAMEQAGGAQAHIIACFDDTGLDAARSLVSSPVIGIGEAAAHVASLVAGRFAVVTTLERSIPALEHNLTRYGLIARCASFRACNVPVLALEEEGGEACTLISEQIEKAKNEDRAEAIVLGCAGMADLAARLTAQHGLPVIDGVASAVALAEGLMRMGMTTSRIGGYAPPLPKRYDGIFAPFAP